MCVDMRVDMRVDMCEDTCVDLRMDMCGRHVSGIESAVLSVSAHTSKIYSAADAALTEIERVRLHGFDEREVDMMKKQILVDLTTAFTEREQVSLVCSALASVGT